MPGMRNSFKKVWRGAFSFKKHGFRNIVIFLISCGMLLFGIMFIWVSTFKIPSIDTIKDRKISQSTKIYDNTGEILLFDVFQDKKRTVIPFDDISKYIKDATIAIEDKEFYEHNGFKLKSFMRAVVVNTLSQEFAQGGSTITQQVVKNSILIGDKTPTRKLKEIVLALKFEKVQSKENILSIYLNENPYGGSVYGVEEASQTFFGKNAKDVTLAEASYLAALPQAPSFYSPYGKNKEALDNRKNLVLREMFNDGKISQKEHDDALKEEVIFLPKSSRGIKAPHFVMFVKEYLEKKYGADVIEQGGLKVTTTLNYSFQIKAEGIAKKYGLKNKIEFNGENAAFVAIDPTTGGILTMVGSRDYFDTEIDGNFNVTTAKRQPGSTFKPFAYAKAFEKGYTPETILFDLPTQFSVRCAPENTTSEKDCYSPGNYDDKFRGPMSMRDALAQSINVPAVKALYLAGIQDTINLAKSMGITSLIDPNIYGLTLVLGGGEVTLLDMTSAYGVFAMEGIRNPYISILKVEDSNGNIIEESKPRPIRVLGEEVARNISSILSDNVARTPLYGSNSILYFKDRDVAVKTGTTNDYKDAWIIGYTPNIVIGTWAGNNNNTAMERKVSGLIVAPMWREFVNEVLKEIPTQNITKPQKEDSYELKPVLRGKWQGGVSNINTQPPLGEDFVFYDNIQENISGGVHSILYWVNKNDPRGPVPTNPYEDLQFERWEYPVVNWSILNGYF